jgi:3'5'-cyclic nucleotide phosphodiesterase/Adenylate and Guanylate cyclase catalytic domain
MNVASRIESTGEKNKIHLSKETARLLPQYMVTKREDVVVLKGKGPQETFWLTLPSESSGSYASSMSDESGNKSDSRDHVDGECWEGTSLEGVLGLTKITSEMESLIDWNVDVLKPLLSAIVSHRSASSTKSAQKSEAFEADKVDLKVHMVIPLPQFDESVPFNTMRQSRQQNVSEGVESELHEFVTALATCYPRNPCKSSLCTGQLLAHFVNCLISGILILFFAVHSFEHCSHVVLSATKLLKRILAPDDIPQQRDEGLTLKVLHEHTFGITSDPICQFAVVFSALIHDVGHSGVSNQRLALEAPELAEKYDHRSIAERRSLDIAFALLQQPRFHELRRCIYQTEAECVRFRNIVVNCVLATDIFEKEGSALRNARWDAAFHEKEKAPDHVLDMNRKATIVLDHIILASDVAHTMQHWHVYKKWNQRLFNEMYNAYLAGRSSFDPSLGWYEGELKFFDNYIIPLAHKLKECGVFGVNSDEYLDYACQNRLEWEQKGADLVQHMVESAVKRASKKQQRNSMETVPEENLDESCSRLVTEVPLDPQGSGTALEEHFEVPSSPIAEVSRFCKPIAEEPADDSISRHADLPSALPQAPRGCRTVIAPQGKLNIILSAAEKGLIRVDSVSKESPLFGLLEDGEYVVSIDGTPTLNMPPFEVGELLNKNRERKFEVISDPFVARALADLHAASLASQVDNTRASM